MMSFDATLQKMQQEVQHRPQDANVYTINHRDTLSRILTEHYNIAYNSAEYKIAEAYALYFNQRIDHPDRIRVGDNIRLMPLPRPSAFAHCPVPDDFHHQLAKTRHRLEPLRSDSSAHLRDFLPHMEQERELFYALARAQEQYRWLDAAVMGFAGFEHIAGSGNRALVAEVADIYQQYKGGKLTRGQYDGQRAKKLKQLSQNLGHLQRFLFDGQTANEAISINRKKGIPATQRITGNVVKLSEFSRLASRSGVILTAVSGAIACDNIGNAETREEKNEIFVEFVGSASVSTGAGIVLGIIFATTPVGWVAALAIGGATVAAGWAGGEGLKSLYDRSFDKYDFVAKTGLDKLC